jgi:hypothetical protein
MRKLSVLLMVCLMGTICSAGVLLNDTFADGVRTNTNLPTESALWASSAADVTTSVGSVAQTMVTSSRRLHTYFTSAGSVSMNVGDKLITTIEFSPETALYSSTSRNFRLGLFHDSTRCEADGVGDSGTSNAWVDATGYAVMFSLSSGTASTIQVGKRNSTTATLIGATGAYLWGTGTGGASNLTLDTVYTMTMAMDYKAVDLMQVDFTFSNAATGWSTTASYTDTASVNSTFEFLQMRLSAASGTADVVDIHSIKVEHVVPEPATLILLGLGGLISLKKRRS